MLNSTLINIENLTIQYDKKTLLKNLSLNINEGDIILLNGTNGSGKTTLLNYIAGIEFSKNIKMRKKINIAFIQQDVYLQKTVKTILTKYFFAYKSIKKEKIINAFNLSSLMENSFSSLSTGEKKRVIIAIAFMKKPNLIIMDEFEEGLDSEIKKEILLLLKNIKKKNNKIAFLFISHKDLEIKNLSKKYFIWTINKNKEVEVSNE